MVTKAMILAEEAAAGKRLVHLRRRYNGQQLRLQSQRYNNQYNGQQLKRQSRLLVGGAAHIPVQYFREGTSDEKAVEEIYGRKSYDRKIINKKRFLDGDHWLDLGAHIGIFTQYMLDKGAKHVYAYEPHPENFALLKKNVGKRATVVHAAVYGSQKPTHLYVAKRTENTWRHSVLPVNGRESIPVKAIEIDRVLRQYKNIKNIKMDVEGAELDILKALKPAHLRRLRKIVFEYSTKHGYAELKKIVKHLKHHGFRVKYPKSLGYPDSLIFCWKS